MGYNNNGEVKGKETYWKLEDTWELVIICVTQMNDIIG